MHGTLLSFRRGKHTMRGNQLLLEIPDCDSREKAKTFVGRTVVWVSPARTGKGKEIRGTITNLHGGNGVLRVRFSRGLPGEALRNTVKILDKA